MTSREKPTILMGSVGYFCPLYACEIKTMATALILNASLLIQALWALAISIQMVTIIAFKPFHSARQSFFLEVYIHSERLTS